LRYFYDFYSDIYRRLGKFELALIYKDSMIVLNSELINEESINKQKELETIYDTEKKQILIDNLAKENELKNIKLEKQNAQNRMILLGLILTAFVIIFILLAYRQKIRAGKIIEAQKSILETKNQEITDSITYAKRIQSAILPSINEIKTCLPNSFVFYKPKDIVAGDFYWLEQKQNCTLLAVADCTGHGVPGAMVSVVCNNALNRSVREFEITDPGEILNKTREIVINEFEKSEEDVKDGMDIALCTIKGNVLQYAGAHNPLWIIRNNELIEIKADKQPIGKFDNQTPFSTHQFKLQKNDILYIFTDGFADQFGGEKGKKFKTKSFKELLLSLNSKPINEQKELIESTFNQWKGDIEQLDDVCVIGVRV
jgi:serine phosphatase RsbU (regulator of sigma subunit)